MDELILNTEGHTKGQTHTVSICSVTYGRGLTGLSRFELASWQTNPLWAARELPGSFRMSGNQEVHPRATNWTELA